LGLACLEQVDAEGLDLSHDAVQTISWRLSNGTVDC
jgi:hypothetical protein